MSVAEVGKLESSLLARREHYFLISDKPELPVERQLRNSASHIGVMWDASLSRLNADKTRELVTPECGYLLPPTSGPAGQALI